LLVSVIVNIGIFFGLTSIPDFPLQYAVMALIGIAAGIELPLIIALPKLIEHFSK